MSSPGVYIFPPKKEKREKNGKDRGKKIGKRKRLGKNWKKRTFTEILGKPRTYRDEKRKIREI